MTHLTRDNLNGIKYVAALHHDDDEIVTHRTCFAVLYGTVVQTAFGRRYIDPDTATIVDYTLLASIGVPNLLRARLGMVGPCIFPDPMRTVQHSRATRLRLSDCRKNSPAA